EVPYGRQKLQITSLEIEPMERSLVVNKAEHTLNIAVRLKEETAIDEVVVVGLTEKRKLETSGFAVAVIETGKAALQSIQTNELLDRSAGIRIRQDGGLGSHIHYNINGL